jgi:hypothetical protein
MTEDEQTARENSVMAKVWDLCPTAIHFGGPDVFEIYESDDSDARVLGVAYTYLGAWEMAYRTLTK